MSQASATKSIFSSKTFWGTVFTAVAAISSILGDAYDKQQILGKDVAQIVVILAGTAATVVGRVQAEAPVYTPQGLPGPNRETLVTSQPSGATAVRAS